MNATGDRLRVVLADGHHFFREGLRGVLETAGVNVVGEARDDTEAVALAERLEPDVLVIDLDDTQDDSYAATLRRLATSKHAARVVVLTASTDATKVLGALEAGARGYILKDAEADHLVDGIRAQASDGQVVLSREIAFALAKGATCPGTATDRAQAAAKQPLLSPRELDVLRLIAGGADNAAIGLELSISRHTVKQHVTNILRKLGVRTRVEAAVYAVRTGLV